MGHEEREPKCQGQHSSSMLALVLLGLVQSSTSASAMKGDSGALPTFAVCVVNLVLPPPPFTVHLPATPSRIPRRHTIPNSDPVSGRCGEQLRSHYQRGHHASYQAERGEQSGGGRAARRVLAAVAIGDPG